ncbi:hypothetical protein CKK33_15065 [Mucilaginibacter sp. MD40]|uniref:hypothetical protein n=1 Tax=Mucilaginibacter sp. MD40 TaxID=2029590 RepID=UPI000BACAD8C|nr:hypothetical protein [Mucilaginibacter sp. MD40]PAW94743.1 hypothetical protein CKK33_15065 [Mucilaginibacter sp. MD40]
MKIAGVPIISIILLVTCCARILIKILLPHAARSYSLFFDGILIGAVAYNFLDYMNIYLKARLNNSKQQ